MPVTFELLKSRKQDYLLAQWQNGELVLEPFCFCGNALDEDYSCNSCGHECDCTFVACKDPEALSIVERLIQSNPNFKNYNASLLDG